MESLDRFDAEIAEIRGSALGAGGLPLLERVEVELAVALRHLGRVRRDGPPLDKVVELEIHTAIERARALIAARS